MSHRCNWWAVQTDISMHQSWQEDTHLHKLCKLHTCQLLAADGVVIAHSVAARRPYQHLCTTAFSIRQMKIDDTLDCALCCAAARRRTQADPQDEHKNQWDMDAEDAP